VSDNWQVKTGDTNDCPCHGFDFQPSRPSGIQDHVVMENEIDALELFLDADLVQYIVSMMNEYGATKRQMNNPPTEHSRYDSWEPINAAEFYKFLAVIIQMGIDHQPQISDYWSTEPTNTEFYRKLFSRNRFQAIYHFMLHVATSSAQGKEKFEPYFEKLIGKFQAAFYPFKNVAIDEIVVGWTGRWKNKQYNASKPKKYHIKTYGLCDSATGYVFHVITYYGAATTYFDPGHGEADMGHAEKVFETLMQNLSEGHHVFADRYYTTRKLVDRLTMKKVYYTGTLNLNRKGFPADLKNLNLEHREQKCFRDDSSGILVTAWRDKKAKKPVVVVSTACSVGDTTVKRKSGDVVIPKVINEYNLNMNGCDRADQLVSYYGMHERKTMKWWKKLFYWSLEIAQVNAFILYKLAKNNPALHFVDFKRKLSKQFLEKAISLGCPLASNRPVGRPSTNVERLNKTKRHLISQVPADRNCLVCSTPQNRKRTTFICMDCSDKPHLHPAKCFEIYHTQLHYK
jgi:hypothetical protein